jgi:hypothetical protein
VDFKVMETNFIIKKKEQPFNVTSAKTGCMSHVNAMEEQVGWEKRTPLFVICVV